MQLEKPTEAQIKEFWEWCGFKKKTMKDKDGDFHVLYEPDGEQYNLWIGRFQGHELEVGKLYPNIDPNNLFKYAIPKITDYLLRNGGKGCRCVIWHENHRYISTHKDPALALFWAIWEVKR